MPVADLVFLFVLYLKDRLAVQPVLASNAVRKFVIVNLTATLCSLEANSALR